MRGFDRFAGSKLGGLFVVACILTAVSYGGNVAYQAVRADFVSAARTATEAAPTTSPDFAALCVDYAAKNGFANEVCEPFLTYEWHVMGKGAEEGLPSWTWNADHEGTFLVTPDGSSIWVPADRRLCPRIIPAGSADGTAGMCPTWLN